MLPLVVMLVGILLARVCGAAGIEAWDDWRTATRAGLALMFVFTGISHFKRVRADLIRMVPPQLPAPGLLVTLTGLAELAGAAGLLIPSLARAAAWGLMLLLVAMFPANIYAAQSNSAIAGRPPMRIAMRLPLQALWIGLLYWSRNP